MLSIFVDNLGARQNSELNSDRRSVVVLGDSMLSKLEGWRMSNRSTHVSIKSFPGATTYDMCDYIKPVLRKKPDNIVIHIGTNNLKLQEPDEVADQIIQICETIENECPDSTISISELIQRSDDEQLSNKVSEVNKALKSFCRSRNYRVINHSNISKDCLNSRGLHLNKKGVAFLASNINNHLRHH